MKYFIKTYGCQMNKADSLWIERILEKLGYEKATDSSDADVILINSCSVRQASEDKVYGLASKIAALRQTRPALRVILSGCLVGSATGERSRIKLDTLRKRMPWVDFFIPPEEIFTRIPEVLAPDGASCEQVRTFLGRPGAVIIGDGKEAYVPVMRGCNQFCSYCVVPYGRGEEHSRPMERIISEVRDLTDQGVSKVTLLGQNVNSYGREFSEFKKRGKQPFAELLRRLHGIEGLEEIWFITSNPWDFSDDLIDALPLPKIRKYLHLPVQSGDDEILRKMNRPYTSADYRSLVRKIKGKVPGMRFGTDIIVGFPGETEEQFQHTVDLVSEIGFDGAYVAMYSPRPGTAAAKLYKDDVPREEKRRRHRILLDLVTHPHFML